MKKIFPFLLMLLVVASCGTDDDDNNNDNNKLSTPLLLVPANNSAVAKTQGASGVEFEWTEIANATQYLLEVSDNANFSNIILSTTRQSNSAYPFFGTNNVVFESGTYYWRVRATGPGFNPSDYSEVYSFNFTNNSGGVGSECEFCNRNFNGLYDITFSSADYGPVTLTNKGIFVIVNFPNSSSLTLYPTTFNLFFIGDNSESMTTSFNITGTRSGNTLTYTNRSGSVNYTTSGGQNQISGSTIINGTTTFSQDNTSVSGTLNLTGGVTGTITFSATL